MADDYRGLAVFAAVAESGSFSAAARRLKLSTSVVSHHVSKLEERLGVSLLYRSTRSLSLTAEGQKVLPAARAMVSAAAEAVDLLAEDNDQLVGALHITMPAFGTNTEIHRRVWGFAKEHPMVAISLRSSDQTVDLVRDGIDMAIRLGVLADSDLRSKRIGTFQRALIASPDYVRRKGIDGDPASLLDCEFIAYSMLPTTMELQKDGEQILLDPENVRLEVDTISAGKAAVLAGLGLQRMPLSAVQDELDDGTLVEVLPGWRPPDLGVYAVWPETGAHKKLTRRMVDYLAAE